MIVQPYFLAHQTTKSRLATHNPPRQARHSSVAARLVQQMALQTNPGLSIPVWLPYGKYIRMLRNATKAHNHTRHDTRVGQKQHKGMAKVKQAQLMSCSRVVPLGTIALDRQPYRAASPRSSASGAPY